MPPKLIKVILKQIGDNLIAGEYYSLTEIYSTELTFNCREALFSVLASALNISKEDLITYHIMFTPSSEIHKSKVAEAKPFVIEIRAISQRDKLDDISAHLKTAMMNHNNKDYLRDSIYNRPIMVSGPGMPPAIITDNMSDSMHEDNMYPPSTVSEEMVNPSSLS